MNLQEMKKLHYDLVGMDLELLRHYLNTDSTELNATRELIRRGHQKLLEVINKKEKKEQNDR